MTTSDKDSVTFGHKKVTVSEKEHLVNDIFSRVAKKYDIMNDAMSLFQHRLWKKKFVNIIPLFQGDRIIDVSCGSGDISYQLYKKAKRKNISIRPITLLDPNKSMLELAKDRFIDKGLLTSFSYNLSSAEKIPFPNNSFDIYTISFGLRNVANRSKALTEAHRVLSPGKKLYCLEFSQTTLPMLDLLYNFYSSSIIPKLASHLANDQEAYKYLTESIETFPAQKQLCEEFKEAGFSNVTYKNLAGGIVSIHIAQK